MSSARKDLKTGKSVDIERLLKEQVAAALAKVQQLIDETTNSLKELQEDKIEALWKDSVSRIREDPACVKNQKSRRGHRTGRVAK
jgi:chromosome condensin MukBEF complex kleisin-like MukF subunit